MRMFLLHDGEDEKKTDELQSFMTDHGMDWEGDNSGITIWLAAGVGDTILIGNDNALRILRKSEPVAITKYSFPHVYRAMLMVEHDNGAHHLNRIHKIAGEPDVVDLDCFQMPYEYGVDKLIEADRALEMLSDSPVEFEDMIIGEEGDQIAVVKRHSIKNPGLETAHALINDWFNAWEKQT